MCDKIQYETYKEARSAAVSIAKRDKRSMVPYKCRECGQFHLTTNGKRRTIQQKNAPFEIKPSSWRIGSGGINPLPKPSKPQSFIHTKSPMITKETAEMLKRIINANNK